MNRKSCNSVGQTVCWTQSIWRNISLQCDSVSLVGWIGNPGLAWAGQWTVRWTQSDIGVHCQTLWRRKCSKIGKFPWTMESKKLMNNHNIWVLYDQYPIFWYLRNFIISKDLRKFMQMKCPLELYLWNMLSPSLDLKGNPWLWAVYLFLILYF